MKRLYPHPEQCDAFVSSGHCADETTKSGLCAGSCETDNAGTEGTLEELTVLRKLTVTKELARQVKDGVAK